MIRRFLLRVSTAGLLAMLVWLSFGAYQIELSWPGGIDPSQLPGTSSERSVRIGLCGRPAELPFKALRRLPELASLKLDFRSCDDPDQRWLLLSAGQLDMTVATLDELALAVPRFDPGVILFPVAQATSCDGLVQLPSASNGTLLVAYPPGDTSRYLAEYLARSQSERESRTVAARSPKQVLEWLRTGQVQAAALFEPQLSAAQAAGAQPVTTQTPPRTPTWEVLVVSRAALAGSSRVSRADLEAVCQAWFNLVDQMTEEPRLTLKAVAEENSLSAEQVTLSLKGVELMELGKLQDQGSALQDQLIERLNHVLTSWSLFGAPNQKGADFSKAIDLSLLNDLKSNSSGGLSHLHPTPTPTETPNPNPFMPSTPSPGLPTPETSRPAVGTVAAGGMLGADPARDGVYATTALMEVNQVVWKFGANSDCTTGVAVCAGNILFGSDDGTVYCLGGERGDAKWRFPCGDKVRSTPAVANGSVYVGCDDCRLYSLKLATGEKNWLVVTDANIQSSPVVVDGKVIVASLDGQVMAVDAANGKELWRYKCAGNVTSSPAVDAGKVVVGCYDKQVYALDVESGEKLWTYPTRGGVLATPCIKDGVVYVGSQDHNFYALRLETGDKLWQFATDEEVTTAAACDQGIVAFGGRDCQIYGLDASSGEQKWKFPARSRICSGATIAQGVVYVGSEDSRLYALDLATGRTKWRQKVDGWVSTPAVVNGTVYFGSTDHNLYALR